MNNVDVVLGDAETCPDLAPLVADRPFGDLVSGAFDTDPAWAAELAKHTIPRARAGVPVFLIVGEFDDIVPPFEAFYAASVLCGEGSEVNSIVMAGESHLVGLNSREPLAWIGARRAGIPVSSGCA